MRRGTGWWWLVALAAAYGVYLTGRGWHVALASTRGADFGSYYYAWRAALAGLDPYDVDVLQSLASQDGVRAVIHPYFYPPPFLLLAPLAWAPLVALYRVWFWVDVGLAALSAFLLLGAWRNDRPLVPWLVAIAFLGTSAVANNHPMGQMNLLVMSLVLAGWRADERGREVLAGAFVGVACLWKMSPAFFVAWWVLRGRWRAVAAAVGVGVALSLIALPIAPAALQWHFYVDVLPGFGSGDYNGLTVPIDLFGNHSMPDLFNRAWPGDGTTLSPTAGALSRAALLTVVGGLAWAFWRPPADPRARAGQLSAVAIAMLLVPVYTYEHHLVWALPAAVAVVEAAWSGRLSRAWLVLGAGAWFVLAFDLVTLKWATHQVQDVLPWLAVALREGKFASLGVLFVGAIALGRSGYAVSPSQEGERG